MKHQKRVHFAYKVHTQRDRERETHIYTPGRVVRARAHAAAHIAWH